MVGEIPGHHVSEAPRVLDEVLLARRGLVLFHLRLARCCRDVPVVVDVVELSDFQGGDLVSSGSMIVPLTTGDRVTQEDACARAETRRFTDTSA